MEVAMDTMAQDDGPGANPDATALPNDVDEATPLPLALKLILLSVFLPEGLSFFVFGLRLTVSRVILLALAPSLFLRLGQKLSTGRYVFVASDLFIALAAVWMFVGPSVTGGFGDALAHSGPIVLEYLIAYMATRLLLTSHGQALAFIGFLCLAISIVVLDALLDTLTGRYFTRELVSQITGFQKAGHLADEIRFGLLRAAGPIEHPIIFGFTSAIGLLFAAWIDIRRRVYCAASCALGVVIGFSSAPQQGAIMGFGLLLYGQMAAGMSRRWLLIVGVSATVLLAIYFSTDTPFGHIIELVTLDPQTGYYRLYVWNIMGPIVLNNPYFGVILDQLDVQTTIDSLWLVLSLSYGIPCAVLTALAMIGSCHRPTDLPRAHLTRSESRIGTVLGVVIFLVMFEGFTVHFWGSIWILVSLLIGLRAHLGELGALGTAAQLNHASPAMRTAEMETYAGG